MTEVFELYNIIAIGCCDFVGPDIAHGVLANYPERHARVFGKLTSSGNPGCLAGFPEDREEFVVGDKCDVGSLDKIVPDQDTIAHYAAKSYHDNSILDPEPFVHTNAAGAYRLLQVAKKYDVRYHHHHVSADGVCVTWCSTNRAASNLTTPTDSIPRLHRLRLRRLVGQYRP